MLRQIRGALGIACLWALAWLPLGGAVALYATGRPPEPSDLLFRPVDVPRFLLAWTVWGGLSGAGFALVLGLAERRRALADLSLRRTALWGALGSMSAPTLIIAFEVLRGPGPAGRLDWRPPLLVLLVSAGLGAACAAATLTLARRPEH